MTSGILSNNKKTKEEYSSNGEDLKICYGCISVAREYLNILKKEDKKNSTYIQTTGKTIKVQDIWKNQDEYISRLEFMINNGKSETLKNKLGEIKNFAKNNDWLQNSTYKQLGLFHRNLRYDYM